LPKKPVHIGGHDFEKKDDARAYVKDLLYKYELGDTVDHVDTQFLKALLDRHPEKAEKIGVGVASFQVRSADFGTRCFWITRKDNSSEKFSTKVCI
jgi:hypothetical protein